jgi:hypothetical protein
MFVFPHRRWLECGGTVKIADDQEWRARADRRRLEDDIVVTAARLIAGDSGAKKK